MLKSENTERIAEFCYITSELTHVLGGFLLVDDMEDFEERAKRALALYSQLGARIKEAADRIGGLQKLAPLLTDVSRRTLSDYVSGKSEPKASTIIEIVEATGVNIQWLVSGTGKISTQDFLREKRQKIDDNLLIEIKNIVEKAHKEEEISLSVDGVIRTSIENYNAMLLHAENPDDVEELRSLIPWIERRVRRFIAAAKANPGTGKRSAS